VGCGEWAGRIQEQKKRAGDEATEFRAGQKKEGVGKGEVARAIKHAEPEK